MALREETRHDQFVELLPQFLLRRRRGWNGLSRYITETGLPTPALMLLRAIVQESDPGQSLTHEQLQANLFNPYSTILPILEQLPALIGYGAVMQTDEQYVVTDAGRALVERIEQESREYVASLAAAQFTETQDLLTELAPIAQHLGQAPEPAAKPHLARAQRLYARAGSPPIVQLGDVIYRLWMARDDAHNAAWRSGGFDGPPFDLLTRVWRGQAATLDELISQTNETQRPDDVLYGVEALVAAGYLQRDGVSVKLTRQGQQLRDGIEAETNRIYFAPWPDNAVRQLPEFAVKLQRIVDSLPQ